MGTSPDTVQGCLVAMELLGSPDEDKTRIADLIDQLTEQAA